jgi:16S rRNA U516 pseudouridylate synthase RsuA-like enzyme
MKRSSKRHAVLSIALREGKKREVRRICRAVGLRVLRLRRVAFAGIRLGDLTAGAVRPLLAEEVAHLKGLSGLEL